MQGVFGALPLQISAVFVLFFPVKSTDSAAAAQVECIADINTAHTRQFVPGTVHPFAYALIQKLLESLLRIIGEDSVISLQFIVISVIYSRTEPQNILFRVNEN